MTDTPLQALAADLNREPDEHVAAVAIALTSADDAALAVAYERAIEASLRTVLLDFRRHSGRPLEEQEYGIARITHAHGFLDGLMLGMGLTNVAPIADDAGARSAGKGCCMCGKAFEADSVIVRESATGEPMHGYCKP